MMQIPHELALHIDLLIFCKLNFPVNLKIEYRVRFFCISTFQSLLAWCSQISYTFFCQHLHNGFKFVHMYFAQLFFLKGCISLFDDLHILNTCIAAFLLSIMRVSSVPPFPF